MSCAIISYISRSSDYCIQIEDDGGGIYSPPSGSVALLLELDDTYSELSHIKPSVADINMVGLTSSHKNDPHYDLVNH